MKLLFSLLGAFFLFTASAQENQLGEIRFLVNVDNGYFEIEVNDTLMLKRYKDSLPAGDYSARVWSPGYEITEVEFSVYAGQMVQKNVEMTKSEDYMRYESEYRDYRMQFHKQFSAPLSLTIGSSIVTGVYMINAYKSKQLVFQDIELYRKSAVSVEIDQIKDRIELNDAKYNRRRTGFYISTGITALLAGGTIWSYINFKNNYTEPIYDKTSPFKDRLSLSITPFGCGLTLNL